MAQINVQQRQELSGLLQANQLSLQRSFDRTDMIAHVFLDKFIPNIDDRMYDHKVRVEGFSMRYTYQNKSIRKVLPFYMNYNL